MLCNRTTRHTGFVICVYDLVMAGNILPWIHYTQQMLKYTISKTGTRSRTAYVLLVILTTWIIFFLTFSLYNLLQSLLLHIPDAIISKFLMLGGAQFAIWFTFTLSLDQKYLQTACIYCGKPFRCCGIRLAFQIQVGVHENSNVVIVTCRTHSSIWTAALICGTHYTCKSTHTHANTCMHAHACTLSIFTFTYTQRHIHWCTYTLSNLINHVTEYCLLVWSDIFITPHSLLGFNASLLPQLLSSVSGTRACFLLSVCMCVYVLQQHRWTYLYAVTQL